MPTFFVRFKAVPEISGSHFGLFAGAEIKSFVIAGDPESALEKAIACASSAGWRFERGSDVYALPAEIILAKSEALGVALDLARTTGIGLTVQAFSSFRPTPN